MLDIRRLSYFLAVAAERSFTRASERLHVAQPALSRQVRLLEEDLGTPLLVRGGSDGISTTPAGALLVERAPALLDELQGVWEQAARLGDAAAEPRLLRLGYAASAGYDTAARIVGALRDRDAAIDVQARVMCVADALDAMRAGTIDVALLRSPPATDDLSAQLVRRELQGVLLHERHPLAGVDVLPLTALRETPIVIHPRDANPGRYDAVLAACRAAGFEPRLEEPLIAFDPAHQAIADGRRATIISDPGRAVPPGLCWRPLAPALVLDVCLLTPIVAAATGTATLIATTQQLSADLGWLEDPRTLKPVPHDDRPELRISA